MYIDDEVVKTYLATNVIKLFDSKYDNKETKTFRNLNLAFNTQYHDKKGSAIEVVQQDITNNAPSLMIPSTTDINAIEVILTKKKIPLITLGYDLRVANADISENRVDVNMLIKQATTLLNSVVWRVYLTGTAENKLTKQKVSILRNYLLSREVCKIKAETIDLTNASKINELFSQTMLDIETNSTVPVDTAILSTNFYAKLDNISTVAGDTHAVPPLVKLRNNNVNVYVSSFIPDNKILFTSKDMLTRHVGREIKAEPSYIEKKHTIIPMEATIGGFVSESLDCTTLLDITPAVK